jgi:hypothetical protein
MSWDLFVMDLPLDATTIDDIPKDFVGAPLGSRSDLVARITDVVPEADFSDPSWGLIDGPDFSIEINMGRDEQVESFAFHVRGGDLAIGVVAEILDNLGLRAVDPQSETGALFTPASARESLGAWRAYRDAALGQ